MPTAAQEERFQAPEDFALMGDWEGQWIDPKSGHERRHPHMAAQLLYVDQGKCRVRFLPALNLRAAPYLEVDADIRPDGIAIDQDGWSVTFRDDRCQGTGKLQGRDTQFELKKTVRLSPTLGLKPPPGAVGLFDGSSFDGWMHDEGDPGTWRILTDGSMESVSKKWEGGKQQGGNLGGTIVTNRQFHDARIHIEFRYDVGPGKSGQGRGNSGILLRGLTEVQILNSYGLEGYWNECGALYKLAPPKVNAAAPPLQWQTYDIDLVLPKYDPRTGKKMANARISVRHNGHAIHSNTELPSDSKEPFAMALQDHGSATQFRNIWIAEAGQEERPPRRE